MSGARLSRRSVLAAIAWCGAVLAGPDMVVGQAQGFRAEVLRDIAELERKYVALAEAMPASALTWRPGEGVRSGSEVFMHVVGANYLFPTFLGTQPPADAPPREAETTWTDNARILPALRASFAHLRAAVEAVPDGDIEKPVRVFGRERSTGSALLLTITHLHEHLGQAIAYARTRGVVPPWSAGAN